MALVICFYNDHLFRSPSKDAPVKDAPIKDI